jgi:type IV secretory pathway TrbF-like protein
VQSRTTWVALLHIVVYPPQVVQDAPAMHNPLGIFLASVQWAERTRSTP